MSKAFTRESDDLPERPPPRPRSALPPGTRNYITPAGAQRLREELDRLLASMDIAGGADKSVEAGDAGRDGTRLRFLQQALPTAEVVPAPPPPHTQVRFGASVTVRDARGAEETFRLVGVDETDPERDWISWLSPLARALLNAQLGQRVRLQLPGGDRELEVVGIQYD